MSQETQIGTLYQPRRWDGEGNGRGVQEGGGMCIPVVDSGGYMAETNTIL